MFILAQFIGRRNQDIIIPWLGHALSRKCILPDNDRWFIGTASWDLVMHLLFHAVLFKQSLRRVSRVTSTEDSVHIQQHCHIECSRPDLHNHSFRTSISLALVTALHTRRTTFHWIFVFIKYVLYEVDGKSDALKSYCAPRSKVALHS